MSIFSVTVPLRKKPIGKMYTTAGAAQRAAVRNAKRLGRQCDVEHWKDGLRWTAFPDGTVLERKLAR
jgi:hypothetical protein